MLKLGIQQIINVERIGICLTSVDLFPQIIASVPKLICRHRPPLAPRLDTLNSGVSSWAL